MPRLWKPRQFSWPTMLVIAVAYLFLYVLLDRVSFIHDLQHTEISPWEPQIALLCAMVMYFGASAAPLTIVAPAISEIVLRGAAPLGFPVMGAMVCIGCTYTAAGLLLRRLERDSSEATIGWLAMLCGVIASAALVDAVLYSAVLTQTGNLSSGSYLEAVRIEWVGDMSGTLVLLPLLLLLRNGEPGKLREMQSHVGLLFLQTVALTASFLMTFHEVWGISSDTDQTRFYLLFLPVIWIALRWGAGVTACALTLLQIGIAVFVAKHNTPESFRAIQLLLVLLAGTGLFMGISVSENARFSGLMRSKDDELSRLSARVAVTEMNSAIGHELNNPLAALVNYLRSATLMMEAPHFDRGALQGTLDRAHGEAIRSVNVVKKLREFFRSGAVQRQMLDPKKLAAESVAAMQVKFRNDSIPLILDAPGSLPPIAGDKLQLSMVLQNLLTNAYDAMHDAGRPTGGVTLRVMNRDQVVEFSVEDAGTGIPLSIRDQIFRPMSSTKSTGMGMGLAICRSLVEANEGRIWVAHSGLNGTCIAFSIPQHNDEVST